MKKKKKNNIFLEKNITEEQFLETVDHISKKLIYKFKFGYHDINDMKQQALLFAFEGLSFYDNQRPLENFLWTHIRNRLFNFKRDNYCRPDTVCSSCPFFDPQYKKSDNQCSKFDNKENCDIYNEWLNRNNNKKKLMNTTDISTLYDIKNDTNIFESISNKEIIDIIENKIELKYRDIYLKLKGGLKVSKQDIKKLHNHILTFLK